MTSLPIEILVVEDDSVNARLIEQFVSLGFGPRARFTLARGIDEARNLFDSDRQRPPDVLVLDYQLDDGTGLDLLDWLRTDHGFDGTAIVLTGMRPDLIQEEAGRRGITNLLPKAELTIERLKSAILGAVDRNRLQRTLQISQAELYDLRHRVRSQQEQIGELEAFLSKGLGARLEELQSELERGGGPSRERALELLCLAREASNLARQRLDALRGPPSWIKNQGPTESGPGEASLSEA